MKKWVTHLLDKGNDLYCLDTKTAMDLTVVHEVKTCGKEQYDIFGQERFVTCQRSISDTITKNNFRYFKNNLRKHIPKLITRLRH